MLDEDPLKILERFHGHLGPYVAIGYRMGALARARLGPGKMKTIVYTGLKPPISCAVDGIQVSTGSTLGKGLIRVENEGQVAAEFHVGDKTIHVKLRDAVRARIDREMSHETERSHAAEMMTAPEDELFEVVV
jgi:formylmethanofuran dehydrogenase subunit E